MLAIKLLNKVDPCLTVNHQNGQNDQCPIFVGYFTNAKRCTFRDWLLRFFVEYLKVKPRALHCTAEVFYIFYFNVCES